MTRLMGLIKGWLPDIFKTWLVFPIIIFGLARETGLAISASDTLSHSENSATAAPLILSGKHGAGNYSAGVDEIIRMLDAQLDAQVILAYIQKSAILYNPDAKDLIALKEHGASTDVLVGLMHRGSELSARYAQMQHAAYPQPANVPPPVSVPAVPTDYAPAQTVPVYQDTYPVYGYSYPIAYNTWTYWWPWGYGCYYNGCWHYTHYWHGHGGYAHGGNFSTWGHQGYRAWNQTVHFNAAGGHSFSRSAVGHPSMAMAHFGGAHGSGHAVGRGRGR